MALQKNVPYVLEKNVYLAVFGWNVLYIYISVKSIWSNVSLNQADASLSTFHLDYLSIDKSGI